jgi:hypothetical protein
MVLRGVALHLFPTLIGDFSPVHITFEQYRTVEHGWSVQKIPPINPSQLELSKAPFFTPGPHCVRPPNSYFSSCFFTQCSFFPFFVLSVASFNSMSLMHTHSLVFFYTRFPHFEFDASIFYSVSYCCNKCPILYLNTIWELLKEYWRPLGHYEYAQIIWETLRTHRFAACLRLFSAAA